MKKLIAIIIVIILGAGIGIYIGMKEDEGRAHAGGKLYLNDGE